jgi:hypothetical protein
MRRRDFITLLSGSVAVWKYPRRGTIDRLAIWVRTDFKYNFSSFLRSDRHWKFEVHVPSSSLVQCQNA